MFINSEVYSRGTNDLISNSIAVSQSLDLSCMVGTSVTPIHAGQVSVVWTQLPSLSRDLLSRIIVVRPSAASVDRLTGRLSPVGLSSARHGVCRPFAAGLPRFAVGAFYPYDGESHDTSIDRQRTMRSSFCAMTLPTAVTWSSLVQQTTEADTSGRLRGNPS